MSNTVGEPEPAISHPFATNAEARAKARRRILKAGIICFNGRHSTLACSVRDLSDTGARLRLTGSISAPDTFELFIELDGSWVDCEVVWRHGSEIGIHFTSNTRREAPRRKQVIQQQQQMPTRPSLRRQPR